MKQYVLHYINEHGDTIVRDYFSDKTMAIKFMEELIATYKYYNENKGLILFDEDGNMIRYYEPENED